MAGGGLLVIMLCFGLAGGVIGRMKGSSFSLWFLISGLVPFLGLIRRSATASRTRSCAVSARDVAACLMLHDAVCVRCGAELEFPEVAVASEAAMQHRAA